MNAQEVQTKIDEKKKEQSKLKAALTASEEKLAMMKVDYEKQIQNGADELELDKLDAELYKADRERTRIEIRLSQCNGEIENLFTEREAAHIEEEDEQNRADEKVALEEAAELETLVQALVSKASEHWLRVERMRRHAQARGATQIPFKLSNLERRISAVFRNGSVNRAFEQPYDEILKSNIASVNKQLKGTSSELPKDASTHGQTEAVEAVS